MKKIILLLALGLLSSNTSFSQARKQLNFGGLGTGLYASLDIPLGQNLYFAPFAKTDWDFNHLIAGAKLDFNFDGLFGAGDAWDFYAGVNGGWKFRFDDNNEGEDFDLGAHIGARWFWSDKWGLNAEFGGGTGIDGGIGITMKL